MTLEILILACQIEKKQFFPPYGGRRTRKVSLLISEAAEMSPHPPPHHASDLQDDLETWTKTQMRALRLFAFNLRLKFTALDDGELHSNIQDQDKGSVGVIMPVRGNNYKSRASQ